MQHARGPTGDGRGVPAGLDAITTGLKAIERDIIVVEERMKDADGVAATTNTRSDGIGQAAGEAEYLFPGLKANTAVEVAHHLREGVLGRRLCPAGSGCRRHW